jgi:hypothetical protein
MMDPGRLEAFSDGVLAIIITIMVLELKVPHGAALSSRFDPPGLLTSEIRGERKIKAGDHDQVHRVEDLFELWRQQGL